LRQAAASATMIWNRELRVMCICHRHLQRAIAAAIVGMACTGQTTGGQGRLDWERLRHEMVDTQIHARGVTNERVLETMRRVPRHLFVPEAVRGRAYDDRPLPLGSGQTISQPFVVAHMTALLDLRATDRVLEIGTGSGYQAAVLAELAGEVYTIEIVPTLARRARTTLEQLGYLNVHAREGNGYLGWPDAAPFDRIILTAAPDEVPATLVDQLAVGGLLVAPVGREEQIMTILHKTDRGVVTRETLPVRFVPMVESGRGN
jgi:protein-L-isoaspartate(D-aspartate) O-methyltransferase